MYIVIEKGKNNRPIGRVVEGEKRGKVVFVDHLLPSSPPYGEVRVMVVDKETKNWIRAKRLEIPEMVPAPIDDSAYPYGEVCRMDWTIELENIEGKIASVLLKIYRRFTYKEEYLRTSRFRRPTHLDRLEVYHCSITNLSIDWEGDGSVVINFTLPEGVKTVRHLPTEYYVGKLDELKDEFASDELNRHVESAKKSRHDLFRAHKSWWQTLHPSIREFLTTLKDCEWWETEDGRFVNHNPHLGYHGGSLRVKLYSYIQADAQLASVVKEKLHASRREAYKGVRFGRLFTKSFKYFYNDLVIVITIFVDTDGSYATTGDEVVIRKK